MAAPETLPGPTGEHNELQLHGKGVFVCISPWNFPLAIFAGQIAAALVTGNTVRGVVYGILGTAIVQGILTAIGLAICGVPRAALLGGAAGLLAVLPVGPPVIWIPAALWLMGTGHLGWGIFLAIYGVVAISGADSLIRPWFIARGADLPFLLTVLGVMGGAVAFGLLGIFLGPVLLGVGYTLMNEWARGTEEGV